MSNNRDGQPSREEPDRTGEELLERVLRAKAEYEQVKSDAAEVKTTRDHLGALHPDGTQASLNALRMERAAALNYMEAIKALSDFTLIRKPSEK